MPKIEAGAQAGFFLLDGFPYQVANYEPVYEPNGTEKFGIRRVGSTAKEMDYLAAPVPIGDWLDNTDTPFADLATLATYLQNFFFRNPVSSTNSLTTYRANNYTDLITNVATSPSEGETAYVISSEGTPWLPGRLGGTYQPSGLWYYNGTEWISDKEAIAQQLQINIDDIDAIELVNASQDTAISANATAITNEATTRAVADTALQAQISINNAKRSYPLADERKVNGHASAGGSVSINVNQVTPAIIPLDSFEDNNPSGLTIGPNGGLVIPANFDGFWAAEYKFTYDFANRSDISGGIDINNTGVILPKSVAPTYNTRNANNNAGSVVSSSIPLGSLNAGDEVILKAFRAGTQAGNVPLNADETVLTLYYLGT